MVHIEDVAKMHINAAKCLPGKSYKGDIFFLTSSKMPNTLNRLFGVGTDGKQGALATEWGLPLPVYLTVEETQSMAAWNRQVYLSTTIPRYAMNLTDTARLMFQSTWWFDSSKAKTDLDWNPVDILEVIRECVAENGVGDDLYKKKQ